MRPRDVAGTNHRAAGQRISGPGKNIFSLSTASGVATQRRIQADVAIDFVDVFSLKHSLSQGMSDRSAYLW